MTISRAERLARSVLCFERQSLSSIHSWRQCYEYFGRPEGAFDHEEGTLRLAFYLASWGMFRGSSQLREFSFPVLSDVVALLRRPANAPLRALKIGGAVEKRVELTALLDGIIGGLVDKSLDNGTGGTVKISVTDTLQTKIALGGLGCLPAYDRFFKDGAKKRGWNCRFNGNGMMDLFQSAISDAEFNDFCAIMRRDEGCHTLPEMRLLDAYLNHLGRMVAE